MPPVQKPCKMSDAGREFMGNVSVTKNNKTCQAWSSQTPNSHSYTDPKMYPDGSIAAAGNRCRNPDINYLTGPWCYTTDPKVPWEDCDIPKCMSK